MQVRICFDHHLQEERKRTNKREKEKEEEKTPTSTSRGKGEQAQFPGGNTKDRKPCSNSGE